LEFADDGTRMAAKVLGCDGPGDIAVLHVDGDVSQRRPLPFAKSGTFEPGDDVIAVGYGFDLYGEPTVTRGIISALHRSLGVHGDLVQTDAAINHGNSGGPLLNLRGEVVGMNSYSLGATIDLSALLSAQKEMLKKGDASTTVPVNDVRNLDFARSAVTVAAYVQNIIANGEVKRFDLGVTVASIDPTRFYLPRQGVVVNSVVPGSQAARIGLKTGDIIYSVELGDGTTWLTPDAAAFEDALALMTPGRSTKIHEYQITDKGIAQAKAQLPVSASDIVWYHADFTPTAPAQKSASR
jgi:S1-C subfamily serine protease